MAGTGHFRRDKAFSQGQGMPCPYLDVKTGLMVVIDYRTPAKRPLPG